MSHILKPRFSKRFHMDGWILNGGTVADQDLARTVYLAFGVQQTMIAVKGGATWSQMVMKKKRKIQ